MVTTRLITALGSVFMLTLAACGGGGGGVYGGGGGGGPSAVAVAPAQSASPSMGESTGPSASAAPSMGESASPSASTGDAGPAASASPGPVTLKIANSKLGRIIVDGSGRTVYTFTPDETAGKPTCYGQCADAWPPVTTTDGVTTGTGIPKAWITTVKRTDGTTQVKVKEYTLYRFSGDKAAGDTNGQRLMGKWFVIGADGETIK